MNAMNDDLDQEAAAAYLGCSVRTLRQRRIEGRGPFGYRIGAKIRFTIEELEQVKQAEQLRRRAVATTRAAAK